MKIAILALFIAATAFAKEAVEPAGTIPELSSVDIVVVGGASGGVEAALAAAKNGAKVFLVAPRPYLGEDICATYRLWLEPGETPTTDLAKAIFQLPPMKPVTPMQVKRALDQALLKNKIQFLYASYLADLLRDADGKPAGVVIANRSGRQAIPAKVIIDATDRGAVARLAGAKFSDYPAETHKFRRIVVGGPATQKEVSRGTPLTITDAKGKTYPLHEYELDIPMHDGSFASFANAEQIARDLTWTKKAVDGSETLFQVPPDSFQARQSVTWPGADKLPLDCLQPAGVERIFVLNGCAVKELSRPVNAMAVGARVGEAAASLAKQTPKLSGVKVAGTKPEHGAAGETRDAGAYGNFRPSSGNVPVESHGLPVLAEYDVVVVGGGTGGAPAGIAAGRQGARTLLLEYLHGLGGIGTLGYISTYYHGNRVGFTTEIDKGVIALGGSEANTGAKWDPEHKSEWYRRELRKAGVDVWYGAFGAGALVENGKVIGVVVLTPQGRGVVLAKVVVDSTGNADIAASAGATCRYTSADDMAVQGTGLPPRELGQRYTNTDYTFLDDTDVFDIWRALVTGREKFQKAYDLGQLVDSRERRQIVGDATLSPMDMMLGRTHPDTVVIARSNFDSHGYIVHPMFLLRPPDKKSIDVRVPWRCLLPKGLDGVIVTGLGVSSHRDAIPVIRMIPDIQNQGYSAGVAAAMIAKKGCTTRGIDIKELQRQLVKKEILPESVLTEKDNFPLPKERVAEAVAAVAKDFKGLEVVLAQFETAQPMLRDAYAKSTGDTQLAYAHILGMMGDATGAETLAKAVAAAPSWDNGWNYKGMGQFGACVSPLDSLIIALGRTKDKRTLAPIIGKVNLLTVSNEFSHFRAVSLALEAFGDPGAAKPLAALLRKEGVAGHAQINIAVALSKVVANPTDNARRNEQLKELYVARALYRCGDSGGVGEKILRQYAQDLHGHYARHAQAVLNK